MSPRPRLPAVLAVVALALLPACSALEDGDKKAVAASASPSANVGALFRAAAVDTDAAGSARYTLTTATTVNGTEVAFSGEGRYDWAADRGQTTYDVPVGKVEQRLLGGDLFLTLPQQPDVFFKLKTADVAASAVGGMLDPSAQLHLLAAVREAEEVGEEEVRGEATTHYRGTYDVARALRGASGIQQPALRSLLGLGAGVEEASYDVFLDDDGLLRRLQQTIEIPAGPKTGGQALAVTTTLELYEFGIEVTVAGPPPKAIRDGAPLLAALRSAMPKPAPASPTVKPTVKPTVTPSVTAEPSPTA